MATVFLNGRFVMQEEARVSAFDSGLLHGVGLFETMLAGVVTPSAPEGDETAGSESQSTAVPDVDVERDREDRRPNAGRGRVVRLGEHMERLIESARALGLSTSLRGGALGDAVLHTVERSGITRARVRLTITGGDLSMLPGAPGAGEKGGGAGDPTVLIVAQPATAYPPAMFERGVAAVIADERVNPLEPASSHKALNYWWRLRALQRAASMQAAEALVFQVTNHLAGGCVSNAMLVKDGALHTPIVRGEEAKGGLASPVLPGITRAAVIEHAQAAGITVRREMLSISDVLGADELFLTNSSWGVLPIVRVEARQIGGGEPGEITRHLRAAWEREAIEALSV